MIHYLLMSLVLILNLVAYRLATTDAYSVEPEPTTTTTMPAYPPDKLLDQDADVSFECPCAPCEVPFERGGAFQRNAWCRIEQTPLTATDALRVLIIATGGNPGPTP